MSLRKETILDLLKLSGSKLPTTLLTSDDIVRNGNTFTVTYYGEPNASYTITGVSSDDIGGEPLTGTFTASGEQLTFTVVNVDKIFTLSLDNGKAIVSVPFIGCEPLTVNFSDPLSSPWTITESRNEGIYAGATYSIDTSGSFWDIEIGYGDGVSASNSYIEWTKNWSYTPQFENEAINLSLSLDLKFISHTDFSPGNAYALIIRANQGIKNVNIPLIINDFIEWKTYVASVSFGSFVVGQPINFSIFTNPSGSTPAPSLLRLGAKNLAIDVNISCS